MTDKKNIEDWVKSNKDMFDDKELPVGHRELFEAKLDVLLQKEKPKKNSFVWLKIAAALVLGVAITSSVFYFTSTEPDTNMYASKEEFSNIENEYSEKIKEALVPVRAEKNYLSPEYRSFLKEMERLDKQNDKLKELLVANPDDERILNSIIENYKSRLQLLEQLKVIMTNKNLKTIKNEESL